MCSHPFRSGGSPNLPPTVTISCPARLVWGDPATFEAVGSDPDGDTLRYEWRIDGKVVPVFDLGLWVDASHGIESGPGTYLLIGGEGDDTAGLLFRGLPALLKPCGDTHGAPQLAALPAALTEFVRGSALDAGGRPHALIDAVALLDTWAAELALA